MTSHNEYPEIAERLSADTIVSKDGNIYHIDDVEDFSSSAKTNEHRIALMHPHSDDHDELVEAWGREQLKIAKIRSNTDFSDRNSALLKMTHSVGKKIQADAASIGLAGGLSIPGYGGQPEIAERAANRAHSRTLDLGEQACKLCPIAEYCYTNPKELRDKLNDKKVRNRFRNRVDNSQNNHFCETNLGPERLKNGTP